MTRHAHRHARSQAQAGHRMKLGSLMGLACVLVAGLFTPVGLVSGAPAAAVAATLVADAPVFDDPSTDAQVAPEAEVEWTTETLDPAELAEMEAAAEASGDTTQTGSQAGSEAVDAEVSPMSIPNPTSSTAVISVKVGGDRELGDSSDTGTVTGLKGVTLRLYTSSTGTGSTGLPAQGPLGTRLAHAWATCTSDADGDCNFIIPITSTTGSNGASQDSRFWVVQEAGTSPAGWYSNPSLRVGASDQSTERVWDYRFRTDTRLRAGETYLSTTPMPGTTLAQRNLIRDSDRGFMRNRVDGSPGNRSTTINDYESTFDYQHSTNVGRTTGVWNQSRVNPDLAGVCPTNIAFLVDTSGSLGETGMGSMRTLMNNFVDAMRGTNAHMAAFSFAQVSPSPGTNSYPTLLPVGTATQAATFKSQYSKWVSSGGTNWDSGFAAVANASEHYDLVIMLTDGNPTVLRNGSRVTDFDEQGNSTGFASFSDVDAGIFSANLLKSKQTSVVAVGIGSAFTATSMVNLRAVSGTTVNKDYMRAASFTDAQNFLVNLVSTTCQGSLGVQKMIVPESGNIADATPAPAGWEFSAMGSAGATVAAPSTKTTVDGGNGKVDFSITYGVSPRTGKVTVQETQQPGYEIVPVNGKNAVCTNVNTGTPVTVTNGGTAAKPGFTVDTKEKERVECKVYNTIQPTNPSACIPSNLYGVTSSGGVYVVPDSGGQTTRMNGWATLVAGWDTGSEGLNLPGFETVKFSVNGLAVTGDGTMYAYARFAHRVAGTNDYKRVSIKMLVKDPQPGSAWKWLDPSTTNPQVYRFSENADAFPIAGTIDPSTGKYVWGGYRDGYFVIYEIDLATGLSNVVGRVAVGNAITNQINGDIAFDPAGNLYVLSHVKADAVLTITTVAAADLAAGREANKDLSGSVAVPSLIPGSIATANAETTYSDQVNGIAVGSNGGLYISTPKEIHRIDPVTAGIISSVAFSNPNNENTTDLASCTGTPTTLTVQKDLRVTNPANHEFRLSVESEDKEITATVAMTPVTGSTVLYEKTGPTMVTTGDTFTLTETSSNLSQYDSVLSCHVDGISGAEGVVPVSGAATTAGSLQIPAHALGKNITCTFTNTLKTGSVSWQKVQKHGTSTPAEYSSLGGSEWKLVGPASAVSTEVSVTDCVGDTAAACVGAIDQDHRKGYFAVPGLAWGEYELIETKAPPGFQLDSMPHAFTIGEGAAGAITLDVDLGKIENRMMSIPGLPLTGGLGEQKFVIAALVLAALAFAGVALKVHRRRMDSRLK